MNKNTVLLVMYRQVLSDGLIAKAGNNTHFNIISEHNYAQALITAGSCSPEIALVEIPESGQWHSAEKCLALCDMIRSQFPGCKQVLLCPETDPASCHAAIQAKQGNRIDDFLFYETSFNYLFSKLEALTPIPSPTHVKMNQNCA